MDVSLRTLDVRPILRAGGEPLGEIKSAVAKLESGQGLRLLASFKPTPLFAMMKSMGYDHSEREIDDGDWEVIFEPEASEASPAGGTATQGDTPGANRTGAGPWQAPSCSLDNRGLMPPEPLVATLEALEDMSPGEVLEGLFDREPLLLYPELDTRGHLYRCEKIGPSEYRVLIRCGTPT